MKEELKFRLIAELLKNARRSDRELARALGTSQPTVTRIRQKIEREHYIRNYSVFPDWRKLGFEIMAFTFTKMRAEILSEELVGKVRKYAEKFPNAIFVTSGEGLGMTGVIVSLHKHYRDYAEKLSQFRLDWGKYMENVESFVMVLGAGEIKEMSFTYLAETIVPKKTNSEE
jgi:DNA-binding Lrp family transcriptional regulator